MPVSRHSTMASGCRMVIGLTWLGGALFNLTQTLRHPSVITDGLATDATFAVFRWFFGDVVGRAPAFWIALLVIVELALGLLTLGRGPWARIGLIGSAAFSAFLFLVIWPYTLMMGAWAILALWLLRYDHRSSILDLAHPGDRSGRQATGSGV